MLSIATDDGISAFMAARSRLIGIAYRMLGSATEAEDIVQEVWLRWQTADRSVVRAPSAFLMTATVRLAINHARSARARRETCVGTWLPEPIDTTDDPALGAERGQALESAVLTLLEKLAPKERAAYVLREAFDYAYPKIAEMLRVGEVTCRQLVVRARRHLGEGRRAPVNQAERRRLLDAFTAAARNGDPAELENLLASGRSLGRPRRNGPAGRRSVAARERVAGLMARV